MLKFILLLFLFEFLFYPINSKNLRNKSRTKNKNKQVYYPVAVSQTTSLINVPTSSYTVVPQNALYTPLTTGTFSSGGQIYQTNAAAIPYGTGYSYGPWQKIKS
jgi:hypothetical protein